MKKPKLKRKNPAAGLDIIGALGLFSRWPRVLNFWQTSGIAMDALMSGLTNSEQIQIVAAAHKKRQEVLAARLARQHCPRCGPISVALSKHTCPYVPKGNGSGTSNAGENASRKPLKGDNRG